MTLNFVKYSKLYFAISALFIIPSLYSLITFGLKPGIDFTGGSLLELKIDSSQTEPIQTPNLLQTSREIVEISSIQPTADTFIFRSKPLDNQQLTNLKLQLEQEFGPVTELRLETVGPTLGAELLKKTIYAVILAALAIMAYVAYQFKELKYGVCAILAMFHDTLIVIGVFSFLGHYFGVEVDTLFVTAVLTILSFSVHDTIVVYDRIRESLRKHSSATFAEIINKSIAETLSRSVNNSMTIIFMLSALYLLGGETIKWFVFALLIGTITGTYSSTFTAAPLLVVWEKMSKRNK